MYQRGSRLHRQQSCRPQQPLIAAAVLPYCCEEVLNLLFLGRLTAPSQMSSLALPVPAALVEELMSF